MTNALEEAIRTTYNGLIASNASFCACQQCRDDVMTLALNHARPRYVTSNTLGAAVTRVALSQDASKAELAVIVYGAMKKIAEDPRHSSPPAAGLA
jgi:competence protein ComFB